ncbi:hypothetical protein BC834DRAFT_1027888 [Gloeopeniophorella convolvens]|nr:hypothetical protein BC834DRAFT_1027888 [Gloeopeniophorella convolvens]
MSHRLPVVWNSLSCFFTRRVLARLLTTFLCCVVLVIRPWSRFGGPSAFLLLTLKELVFSAQENLAQHVEATVLNIMGALLGIGLSTMARYLASLPPDGTASSRVIPAVFLITITSLAGYAKSRLPRLQLSARISCFVSIWILTTNAGISSGSVHAATYFVWITLSAATVSLFSNMLLLRWFSTHFARKVADAFSKLHQCLSIALEVLEAKSKEESLHPDSISRQEKLLNELLAESVQLDSAYSIAAFELRLGRISVESIKPLIGVVENTRRELSWGTSRIKKDSGTGVPLSITTPAVDLGGALIESMKYVEEAILFIFEHTPHPPVSTGEKDSLDGLLHRLDQARDTARNELAELLEHVHENTSNVQGVGASAKPPDHALFFVSLIEMADEVRNALLVADKILAQYDTSRTRLWYPRLSWAWLGAAPPTIVDDDGTLPDYNDPERFEDEHRMSMAEAREGLSERARRREADSITLASLMPAAKPAPAARRLLRVRDSVLPGPRVIRARLLLATLVRAIAHSSHLQHAIKNAIGVALLSLPAFLPTGSPGQRWFVHVHGQWMIISYVWVLETNTGATWRVAYLRIAGTILGAVYAYITWLICHTNPYGIVTLVTFADVPISWLITRTDVSSLGVVASVTLPPIVFARYLSPSTNTSIILLAVWRAVMITAGVLAALIMNTFVFPRHCRVLFLRNTSRTLSLLSQLYLTLGRELFQRGRAFTHHDRRRTLKLELETRNSLIRLSRLVSALQNEMSLLPKPMIQYHNTISLMQAMLDTMTGLRKIREHIPVPETVTKLIKERREFVSCVCVSLYAGEHAFRARQPLPQFLPSARHARRVLVARIAAAVRRAPAPLGLAGVYAAAEAEVLAHLVETLEGLLNVCRALFGTAAWLTEGPRHAGSVAVAAGTAPADDGTLHEWDGVL